MNLKISGETSKGSVSYDGTDPAEARAFLKKLKDPKFVSCNLSGKKGKEGRSFDGSARGEECAALIDNIKLWISENE